MSKQTHKAVIDLIINARGTHKEIGKRLGVSPMTVGRYRQAAGITKSKNEHIETAKIEAIRLLKSGMIRQRVAEILKTQPATVGKWADDAGLPRARPRKEKRVATVEEWLANQRKNTEAAK